jgi:hypothetical protein
VSKPETITKINFHPFMSDMTVSLEREFVAKDGVKMARVKDLKGRGYTVPLESLNKKTRVETSTEPKNRTYVVLSWGGVYERDDDYAAKAKAEGRPVRGPWFSTNSKGVTTGWSWSDLVSSNPEVIRHSRQLT